ncbi:hypothetical protein COTS27_01277 [Spirochaetota bacterium]|nr:hypothetical protein COTS27_01277 [Spirochaetota bacterium]
MQQWFLQLGNLLVYIVIATLLAVAIIRAAPVLFNIDFVKEIRQDNRSAAYFLAGLLVMIGLIVGLFNL